MKILIITLIPIAILACTTRVQETAMKNQSSKFVEDVNFLKQHGAVIELVSEDSTSRVALMPGLQGRVMTSTADGKASYGWINRALFASKDTSKHMNAYGGEERFWIGPEGGQFSVFFEKGKEFTLDNWHTPRLIDLDAFEVLSASHSVARFTKDAELINYSGFTFKFRIDRTVKILEKEIAYQLLGISPDTSVNIVAYESTNSITNTSDQTWTKETGLLSIWMLGMFQPSPTTTIIIPFNDGEGDNPVVNDSYFGKVPGERLKVDDGVIYFKGDGEYRSKIGLTPTRAKDILASYDETSGTLTIVRYSKPEHTTDYVNSMWEIQREPFRGDAINSYNDGPPSPGEKSLGPFYELETSSPAYELKSGEAVTHTQTTFHIQGSEEAIDNITKALLGVSVSEIKEMF